MVTWSKQLQISAIGALVLAPGAALGHHSFSMFDATRDMTIEGTVSAFTWTNPHVWIDVIVDNGGEQERWGIETQSIGILYRQGWKADSVKVGERVRVELHPMKDGTPGGQLMKIVLPDGKELLTSMARRAQGEATQSGQQGSAGQAYP